MLCQYHTRHCVYVHFGFIGLSMFTLFLFHFAIACSPSFLLHRINNFIIEMLNYKIDKIREIELVNKGRQKTALWQRRRIWRAWKNKYSRLHTNISYKVHSNRWAPMKYSHKNVSAMIIVSTLCAYVVLAGNGWKQMNWRMLVLYVNHIIAIKIIWLSRENCEQLIYGGGGGEYWIIFRSFWTWKATRI